MTDLEKQAKELGIKVDGRWSAERLQAEIDEKLAADPEPEAVEEAAVDPVAEAPVVEQEAATAPVDPEPEADLTAANAEIESEIQARFDASQDAAAEPVENSITVINLQANPMAVLGLTSYGSAVLTERQLNADPRLYAKIKRGVDLGILKVEQ